MLRGTNPRFSRQIFSLDVANFSTLIGRYFGGIFEKNNSAPNGKEPEAKEEAGESHSWTFDIDACRRFDGLCFSFVLWN